MSELPLQGTTEPVKRKCAKGSASSAQLLFNMTRYYTMVVIGSREKHLYSSNAIGDKYMDNTRITKLTYSGVRKIRSLKFYLE
jgi:hypothetical protein